MRPLLLLFLASLFSLTSNSQTYYMCASTASSNANFGTLYDSGGPSSNYSYYENCQFLIATKCPGNITLTFSYFSTESGYDYLTVYDGNNTSAPILGSYWGTGSLPPFTATSGSMLVTFYSDGSTNYGGFVANWSFSNPNCPPVANFSTTINSCQGKVNFTDATTNNPNSWIWNFGDGNGSTLPNPVHTYTAPGTYPVTLISGNSNGNSTITKNVTVNPILFQIGYNGEPLMNSALSFTTDNTTGQVYTWTFGDGAVAGSAFAIHTYTAIGNYTAALSVASGTCVTTNTMLVKIQDGVGISEKVSLPYHVNLAPNPFKEHTVLNVQLAEQSDLTITVVNQLGQVVQQLANSTFNVGQYNFDINSLPSGVYHIVISNGEYKKSLKLISLAE